MAPELTSLMKVRLLELPTESQIELSNTFVRETLAGLPLRVALERRDDDPNAGSATANLSLYVGAALDVFASGTLRGWLEIACCRCVGTIRLSLDEQINVTFCPRERLPQDPEEGEEVEVTEDDVDLFPYDGEEIDLEPLLREQLVLAVPYAPLCKEECLGLCAKCGADLNTETCDCDRRVVDPRFEALKGLKV